MNAVSSQANLITEQPKPMNPIITTQPRSQIEITRIAIQSMPKTKKE